MSTEHNPKDLFELGAHFARADPAAREPALRQCCEQLKLTPKQEAEVLAGYLVAIGQIKPSP